MPRRVIDHTADRALHKQLADILREGIHNGTYAPGDQLPSEPRLAQIHELGRETIRRALDILKAEGLITSTFGLGTFVREPQEYTLIKLRRGEQITTRMPTPSERSELGVPEGVPVFVIRSDEGERLEPGDSTVLEA
jgi:GntR family transcriptional regulator